MRPGRVPAWLIGRCVSVVESGEVQQSVSRCNLWSDCCAFFHRDDCRSFNLWFKFSCLTCQLRSAHAYPYSIHRQGFCQYLNFHEHQTLSRSSSGRLLVLAGIGLQNLAGPSDRSRFVQSLATWYNPSSVRIVLRSCPEELTNIDNPASCETFTTSSCCVG